MVSVVMSTYNGEKYIEEQLESLLRQTRKPDEVLILDDCSTDNTFHICQDFIDRNSLWGEWSITQNKKNIGWAENFHQGFDKAQGDIIFPCDQDDIWFDDKIERMVGIVEGDGNIGLLICGHIKQIEDGTHSSREDKTFTSAIIKLPFDSKVIYVDYPGCVYCFTKRFYKDIRDYCFEGYPHDAFLLRMGRLTEKAYYYDFPGIYWRRHLSNATGKPVRENDEMRRRINYYIDCLKMMDKWCEEHDNNSDKRMLIAENIAFYQKRKHAFENRKIVGRDSLFSLLKYLRFYPKNRSILGDVVRIIH